MLFRSLIHFITADTDCAQTKLFVLSDPPIAKVFSDERRSTGEITPHMRAMMDDLGLSADVVGASSIFTGDEEVFAFARAVVSREKLAGSRIRGSIGWKLTWTNVSHAQSRITEMGSVQWARQHAVNSDGQGLKEEQVSEEGAQVATA